MITFPVNFPLQFALQYVIHKSISQLLSQRLINMTMSSVCCCREDYDQSSLHFSQDFGLHFNSFQVAPVLDFWGAEGSTNTRRGAVKRRVLILQAPIYTPALQIPHHNLRWW